MVLKSVREGIPGRASCPGPLVQRGIGQNDNVSTKFKKILRLERVASGNFGETFNEDT